MSDTNETTSETGPPEESLSIRRMAWLAVGLAIIGAFAFQGSRGLRETTEGRYAECARQTLETGRLSEPILNGENHWTKPPLTYASIAAGYVVFGKNTWGARAYLAFAFIGTVIAVLVLGSELWGPRAGPYCALVYATSPFTLGAANTVSTDTLLALWEALALMFFWLGVRRRRGIFIVLMWLSLGLAFSTKGPVGLLPLIAIVPTHLILKYKMGEASRLLSAGGLTAFAVAGLSWYALEIWRHPELFRYWVVDEVVGRTVSGTFQRNPGFSNVFKLYVPFLLLGTGPWLFMVAARGRSIPWPKGQWLHPLRWENGLVWTFLMLSFLPPVAIFFLAKSKLMLYILPLFVPMSLALGKGIETLVGSRRYALRTVAVTAIVMTAILAGSKAFLANVPDDRNMLRLSNALDPVLDRYPDHRLFVARGRPLNGLQFYLNENVPSVKRDGMSALINPDPIGTETNIILVQKENLHRYEDILRSPEVEFGELDDDWLYAVRKNDIAASGGPGD